MFKFLLIIIIFYTNSIHSEILNQRDQNLYFKIFDQYRNGDFKNGEINIAKLDNNILLGHVEALKLLHPTKHRSSFLELKNWLNEYNDHYESRRIYKLSVKRMPKDSKSPKKSSSPILEKKYLIKLKNEKNVNLTITRKIFTKKTTLKRYQYITL